MEAAESATEALLELSIDLGSTVSGEHGVGSVKQSALTSQLSEGALRLQRAVKDAFDPLGLMNPGKKGADRKSGAPRQERG